jgi:hypothetical protein
VIRGVVSRAVINNWAANVTAGGVRDDSSADLASRDSASEVTGLEGLADWVRELLVVLDGSEPEAVGGSKVVAGTLAVALDEWRASEGLEARSADESSLTPPAVTLAAQLLITALLTTPRITSASTFQFTTPSSKRLTL